MTENTDDSGAIAARSRAYRRRRRAGVAVLMVEADQSTIAALRRLGLVAGDGTDRAAIADAAARFLSIAPSVAAMGEALYPPAPR